METRNIEELVDQALVLCRKHGFTEQTIYTKHKVFKAIIRMHIENGCSNYNDNLLTEYIAMQKNSYGNGKLRKDSYNYKVKTASQLRELLETESINYGHMNRKTGMTDYYSGIVNQMLSFSEWDEKYAHGIRRYVMPFFKWLAANQIEAISDIDEAIIRKYMMDAAKRLKLNSIHHINRGLKQLFYFLNAERLIKQDFSFVFSLPLPKEHIVRRPVPHEEVAAILKSIDQSTPQGKRDYAMILIGTVTGLRSVDIRNLKFENIDWIKGEIRISQEKTGKALALPLTADVGEALKSYILSGRPCSDSESIFLRTYAPHPKLTTSVLYNVYNKYRFALGLPRRGFHDLRRALGTSLVTTGTSVTTVAQVLGHRNLESTKQYISLDTDHLRDVGLGLKGFMPKEGGDGHDIQ